MNAMHGKLKSQRKTYPCVTYPCPFVMISI